ncbi:hypothetical protein LJR230_003376 [Trinickia sp. LjRoot230]|uniref:hypothetical protein n=1 Tax=Trinickia sp. LjRoot230 TaxID=3342288 RepID=UPI003ECE73B3
MRKSFEEAVWAACIDWRIGPATGTGAGRTECTRRLRHGGLVAREQTVFGSLGVRDDGRSKGP